MNNKIKILFLGPDSVHLKNFLELIKSSNLDSYVFCEGNKIISDCMNGKLTFSFRVPCKTFLSYMSLFRSIKNLKPDLVHVHQANFPGWITVHICRRLNIPVVVSAWGSDILIQPNRGFFLRQMTRYIVKNANWLIADAGFVIFQMEKIYQTQISKSSIIYPPIALSDDNETRSGWQKKDLIVYSNRLHELVYRIDRIIIDFNFLVNAQPETPWRLVIAANGSLTPKLKELTISLGLADRVDFVGWLTQHENIQYYRRSKIYCSSPISDGTSISLLEAMAHGCIPVVSEVPSNHEWVLNGVNGVVGNRWGMGMIIDAIPLLNDHVRELNYSYIKRKSDRDIAFTSYYTIYKKLINYE